MAVFNMSSTHQRLTLNAAAYLILATILWGGNAIVGRWFVGHLSPALLNLFRWIIAAAVLMPFAWKILLPQSLLWQHKKRFLTLSLLGVGCYNAFLYIALETSSPINVTLIGASMPIWMLLIGSIFYQNRVNPWQMLGAVVSIIGVTVVLSRGNLDGILMLKFVPGDMLMVAATLLWACYSWMLSKPGKSPEKQWPWTEFLLAQIVLGLIWSLVFAGFEFSLGLSQIDLSPSLSWPLLIFCGLGPALIAYRCWSAGVAIAGPNIAGFFGNLIPLFTALFAAALLGDMPHLFHAAAFGLIVAGIVISSQLKTPSKKGPTNLRPKN